MVFQRMLKLIEPDAVLSELKYLCVQQIAVCFSGLDTGWKCGDSV